MRTPTPPSVPAHPSRSRPILIPTHPTHPPNLPSAASPSPIPPPSRSHPQRLHGHASPNPTRTRRRRAEGRRRREIRKIIPVRVRGTGEGVCVQQSAAGGGAARNASEVGREKHLREYSPVTVFSIACRHEWNEIALESVKLGIAVVTHCRARAGDVNQDEEPERVCMVQPRRTVQVNEHNSTTRTRGAGCEAGVYRRGRSKGRARHERDEAAASGTSVILQRRLLHGGGGEITRRVRWQPTKAQTQTRARAHHSDDRVGRSKREMQTIGEPVLDTTGACLRARADNTQDQERRKKCGDAVKLASWAVNCSRSSPSKSQEFGVEAEATPAAHGDKVHRINSPPLENLVALDDREASKNAAPAKEETNPRGGIQTGN
ncbi:hypothetical protein B0H16DRAFT_1762204 [Mycena metata]|uniref:Uncharacterized protein n=1 Tax=Mycena metata TaxID=1033252 RepID=A0AAD7IAW8_9AGAR|nr:hypothetical protein B0H16DRAFT_1762204 [Mycena metata]